VIVATHQPIFLPWSGLFHKALHADVLVLLDDVQFPQGRGWMSRNRLKSPQGELWLTVPVHRKGRGKQRIRDVKLVDSQPWRRDHLQSIGQHYADAPYLRDYLPPITDIYHGRQRFLSELNLAFIRLLRDGLGLGTTLLTQSELGVSGGKTQLLAEVCRAVGADSYVALCAAEKYIDPDVFRAAGIALDYLHYRPPLYPQLWGWGIYNLSALDLLLNCGPRSMAIIQGAGR